jgi:hypothetical protein
MSEDEFGAQFAAAMSLSAEIAEPQFRRLLAWARAEKQPDGITACLSQLSACLAEQNKLRESLRVAVELVREQLSARSITELAYSLERYGWLAVAEHFFERALQIPEDKNAAVQWHEHARVGAERARARRIQRSRTLPEGRRS